MTKVTEKTKILVIEDEVEILNFASLVLELEGYQVLKAEDGESGLRMVRQNQVALVLLDLRLPQRDGWGVLEQLRTDPELSSIPIVMFTASAGIPQRERAAAAGVNEYLVKPLSAASLKKVVARNLQREVRR